MSRMLNALKQIEAMSPHPPLPPLPTEATDTQQAEPPSRPTISDEQDAVVAEESAEVRDEAAVEDSLLQAEAAVEDSPPQVEAAVVAENLPTQQTPLVGDTQDRADAEAGISAGAGKESLPAYRALADEILSQLAIERPAALMFTSPHDGGGTTELLASLAAALVGRIDGEILLVDVDLHDPQLAGQFGIETTRGLADVIMGVAIWSEVVYRTELPGVSILPGVRFPRQGGRAPERLNLGPLLDELAADYRLVLLDTASLGHGEIAPLSRWCQGTYLAIRLGRTTSGEAKEAVRMIRSYGGQVSGCVVVT